MKKLIVEYLLGVRQAFANGWDKFWFAPRAAETLAIIRICTGLMIFYTHLVWTKGMASFLSDDGQISRRFAELFHDSQFAWSHFYWFESSAILMVIHVLGLIVVLCFTLGLFTRITSVLTFLLTVSYVHRAAGSLFGLDQINVFLAMYLMLGDAGGAYSLDALRRGARRPAAVMTNVATRLIQLHMCIVYLFAALGKLQGTTWWEGTAIWLALANYEYQSIDMTWLGQWPLFINLLTHITVAWELSYSALIWPRWTRPIVLALAIPIHLGIAFTMGMITFGLIMLVGNLAFVSPALTRMVFDRRNGAIRQEGS